ncbi:tetratricopeptide repeat protein [Streptomyces sp. R35]|uniref:Tetratricopeptide repeat protein n=1 Tax=Streptomyces sp. R35 TaxID=3238630 RepID=A0AB39S671_9ACTN
MQIQERQPVLTWLQPEEPSGPRLSSLAKRALIGVVAGSVVLGGVLVLLPSTRHAVAPRPVAGPPGRANAAVTAGVPVAVSDLVAVIGDREAHLRAHPRDGRAWAVLGTAYAEQARRTGMPAYYPKAEKALRASLQSGPEQNQAAMDGLMALANARGDFLEAQKWGEEAVEQSPKRWTTYALLIDTYTGLGNYKATRSTLEKLQALHKGPRVLAQASRVYWSLGWREDAVATISDAAAGAATPAERAAYLQQAGELAWERGEVRQSLRYYKAALASDPDEHGSLAGQGRALAALGRMSEAMRAYQTALARQPAPRYALELGELYEKLGLTGAARVQYGLLRDRVRQEEAGGVDDELVLGLFEADHGDPRAAVRRLRAECERQPGIPVADALGWALHRAGNDKEALKFAKKAMDKDHGGGVRSALYAYHRGQIERELDLIGPARRHLAEALMINPHFSPLFAPAAHAALTEMGQPSEEGPPDPSKETEKSTEPATPAIRATPGTPERATPPALRRPASR